ncbi:DUF3291 domain-containing protein [Streptomyces sp. NPDC005180]|uniref:DUF3291 domain-containing protein n=1 Tax=Streptomyces sp. NPDC005180 TaxID=3156868 RepID=UPI0033B226C1
MQPGLLRGLGEQIGGRAVWGTQEALWDFTYRSGYLDVMRRRREWFERHIETYLVLWWVPAGRLPPVGEALERLADLRANGPSPRAFTFTSSYTAAEAAPYLRSQELRAVPSAPGSSAGDAPDADGGAAAL